MNDNLKNYKADPDPAVWKGIEKTLRRRALRRYGLTAAVGATIAAAAVALWPQQPQQAAAVAVVREAQQQPVTEPAARPWQMAENMPEAAERAAAMPVPDGPKALPAAAALPPTAARAPEADPVPGQPAAAPSLPAAAPAPQPAAGEAPAPAAPAPQPRQMAEDMPAPARPATKSSFSTNIEDTILWLPNVFAPGSGDEAVSVFRARLNKPGESISNFKMMIFNRAGHQVFVSHDINYGWDGTYKGRELPQATYVYVLYYTDSDRFQHQRKGTITLVR